MTGTALVTGGASGLGEALVRQLLAREMRVVCVDVQAPKAAANVTFVRCDLADRRAYNVAWSAIAEHAPFDLVVLNAGVSATGPFEQIPGDVYQRLITVNAEAPIRLTTSLMRETAVRRGGRVVFVSSLSHFTGYPGAAVYAATKDALAIYAKSIRPALKRKGITVSCCFPGPMRTAHAARHAPAGADAERRMPPSEAALALLSGAQSGRRTIIPGFTVKLIAVIGRLVPSATSRWIHRQIFLKLGRTIY